MDLPVDKSLIDEVSTKVSDQGTSYLSFGSPTTATPSPFRDDALLRSASTPPVQGHNEDKSSSDTSNSVPHPLSPLPPGPPRTSGVLRAPGVPRAPRPPLPPRPPKPPAAKEKPKVDDGTVDAPVTGNNRVSPSNAGGDAFTPPIVTKAETISHSLDGVVIEVQVQTANTVKVNDQGECANVATGETKGDSALVEETHFANSVTNHLGDRKHPVVAFAEKAVAPSVVAASKPKSNAESAAVPGAPSDGVPESTSDAVSAAAGAAYEPASECQPGPGALSAAAVTAVATEDRIRSPRSDGHPVVTEIVIPIMTDVVAASASAHRKRTTDADSEALSDEDAARAIWSGGITAGAPFGNNAESWEDDEYDNFFGLKRSNSGGDSFYGSDVGSEVLRCEMSLDDSGVLEETPESQGLVDYFTVNSEVVLQEATTSPSPTDQPDDTASTVTSTVGESNLAAASGEQNRAPAASGEAPEWLTPVELPDDAVHVERLRDTLVRRQVPPDLVRDVAKNIKCRENLIMQLANTVARAIHEWESSENMCSVLREELRRKTIALKAAECVAAASVGASLEVPQLGRKQEGTSYDDKGRANELEARRKMTHGEYLRTVHEELQQQLRAHLDLNSQLRQTLENVHGELDSMGLSSNSHGGKKEQTPEHRDLLARLDRTNIAYVNSASSLNHITSKLVRRTNLHNRRMSERNSANGGGGRPPYPLTAGQGTPRSGSRMNTARSDSISQPGLGEHRQGGGSMTHRQSEGRARSNSHRNNRGNRRGSQQAGDKHRQQQTQQATQGGESYDQQPGVGDAGVVVVPPRSNGIQRQQSGVVGGGGTGTYGAARIRRDSGDLRSQGNSPRGSGSRIKDIAWLEKIRQLNKSVDNMYHRQQRTRRGGGGRGRRSPRGWDTTTGGGIGQAAQHPLSQTPQMPGRGVDQQQRANPLPPRGQRHTTPPPPNTSTHEGMASFTSLSLYPSANPPQQVSPTNVNNKTVPPIQSLTQQANRMGSRSKCTKPIPLPIGAPVITHADGTAGGPYVRPRHRSTLIAQHGPSLAGDHRIITEHTFPPPPVPHPKLVQGGPRGQPPPPPPPRSSSHLVGSDGDVVVSHPRQVVLTQQTQSGGGGGSEFQNQFGMGGDGFGLSGGSVGAPLSYTSNQGRRGGSTPPPPPPPPQPHSTPLQVPPASNDSRLQNDAPHHEIHNNEWGAGISGHSPASLPLDSPPRPGSTDTPRGRVAPAAVTLIEKQLRESVRQASSGAKR